MLTQREDRIYRIWTPFVSKRRQTGVNIASIRALTVLFKVQSPTCLHLDHGHTHILPRASLLDIKSAKGSVWWRRKLGWSHLSPNSVFCLWNLHRHPTTFECSKQSKAILCRTPRGWNICVPLSNTCHAQLCSHYSKPILPGLMLKQFTTPLLNPTSTT